MYEHNVCSVTGEPPLNSSSATEQLRGDLHKSEVLLTASTLLVGTAENTATALRRFASHTARIIYYILLTLLRERKMV